MTETSPKKRLIAQNRKARFEFEVLDTLECGIALQGTEVKSLRKGECTLGEAYASIRNGELWLINCHIPEYAQGNIHNHVPARDRKLLAHKKEIAGWFAKVKEKGMTIVPLALYFIGSRIKLELALCKGKKLYDKRETERKKEADREATAAIKTARGR